MARVRLSGDTLNRAWRYWKRYGAKQTLRRVLTEARVGTGNASICIDKQQSVSMYMPVAEPLRPMPPSSGVVKAIAFYLPQFHPIPENDAWWGEGFTEWTNVTKASPVFSGHLQPKLPGPLGFYDLRLPEVMRKQATTAKQFGIHGFCFHYYWFAGKRLLERPLEQLLADPSIDIPFCLCWANENWTRRWDGHENEVLITQRHSDEDDKAVMRDMLRYMADPRYIRVEGRPMLLVYRASLFPDMRATLRRWREVCAAHGEQAPFFVMVQSFENFDPKPMGFDAAVQFPPHPQNRLLPLVDRPDASAGFQGQFVDYASMADLMMETYNPKLPGYPCVMPGWDNTPRRGPGGTVFVNSTPAQYERWLRAAIQKVWDHYPPERAFVFINAWNEWAEGAYLEPDKDHGYAYLNATARALASSHNTGRVCVSEAHRLRVLFVGHDAARAGAQMLLLHTLRWLKRHAAVDSYLLLLGDGELRGDYEACCPVLLCPDGQVALEDVETLCPRLDVICGNSAVSACCYDVLADLGIPIVTYVHEMENSLKKWTPSDSIEKMCAHTVLYLAASRPVKDNLCKNHAIPQDCIRVVNAFIEPRAEYSGDKAALRRRLGLPDNACIVLGCGSLDWRKGPDLFVEVARLVLQKSTKPVHFCWVGGGEDPAIADPRILAQQYGIADKIFFAGHCAYPEEFFRASDIFLLSSREDPFPLVALEACEAAMPVVCFEGAGGMPDFIRTGAGFAVPYADVEAMATQTLELIIDEKKRRALGQSARSRLLDTHTVDIAAPHILLALREAAKKPHPVSVIVPNYNYARYLPERMASIFDQSFRDMEIILLDDASTDDSLHVLEQWTHRAGVSLIVNEKNSGNVSLQWKKGLEKARGGFIWIAEADDNCEPHLLATLLPPLQKEDVVLAYSIPSVIDSEGHPVDCDYRSNYLAIASKNRWEKSYVIDGYDEITNALGIVNCIPNISAVLFRKPAETAAIDAAATFICSGDWMFYLHLAKHGRVAYAHGDLARHRRHGQSVIAQDASWNKRDTLRIEAKSIHEWVIREYAPPETVRKSMLEFVRMIDNGV